MINLSSKQLEILSDVLKIHTTKAQEVYAYGSRVKKTNEKFSDIDLLVVGNKLPDNELLQLKEAFSESDLPFFVDIHNREDIDEHFYQMIKPSLELIEL
ncbi:MAG: DNA polymerase subunit beta [Gammaproteobacteria bacterium]|nr:MAG: DNA polymerase subunit beta [Gammaproteobacteria bacterium]